MVRNRSSLGFFFLTKVYTRFVLLRRRRFLCTEQNPPSNYALHYVVGTGYTPLPSLARRRLYSRLLTVSSGTVAKLLSSFIARFFFTRYSAKHAQIYFRHTQLPYYISLQRSNQFIMVRNTRSLFTGRQLCLSIWVLVSGATARFIFTSLSWGACLFGRARVRGFSFFVWALSWHFRYFRMSNQPLLLLDVVHSRSWLCSRGSARHSLSYISFVGARLTKYQTNYLICSLLSGVLASEPAPVRETLKFLSYQGLSSRTSHRYLLLLARKASLGFFYSTPSTALLSTSYYLRLVVLVGLCFFAGFVYSNAFYFLYSIPQERANYFFKGTARSISQRPPVY
uniref:hypothetical protein n=1 Tax=Euplotes cristatus TaxID=756077 RepID=UPI002E7A9EFC|nr:hypothetical protein V3A03_mgp22 [Euplotes cristatus]UPM52070.1 hypothetical protein [Euplotes cristatus]